MTRQTDKPKRSLLREAKKFMDDTFVGGNELVQKIRALIKEAYANLANLNTEGAAAKLVQAYETLKSAHVNNENAPHFRAALHVLDFGLFLYEFASADDELREIAWDIWDNSMYFHCELYEAILSARLYLSFIKDGVMHEVAIEEVIAQNPNPKLKEILEGYADKAQRGGNTGRDSEGAQ